MKVVCLPENGKKFITYEVMGKIISFNNGDLMFDVSKKERDYEVIIDICQDYTGGLVMGAAEGQSYVAQLIIPARVYIETLEENPDYNPGAEGTETSTIVRSLVPFDIEQCELRLWELEV